MIVSAVVLSFTSCADGEEIDVKYGTTISVSAKNVLQSFIEKKPGDFTLADEEKLRISLFLYGDDDKLIANFEQLCSGYDEEYSFTVPLSRGKYKVIALSNVVVLSEDGTFEIWKYANIENYNKFRIETSPLLAGFSQTMLGLIDTEFSVNDSQNNNVVLSLNPATSFAVLTYHNCINSYVTYLNWKDNAPVGTTGGPSYDLDFQFLYTSYDKMEHNGMNEWVYSNDLSLDKFYKYTHLVDPSELVDELLENIPNLTISQLYDYVMQEDIYKYGYLALLPGRFSLWCNYTINAADGRSSYSGFGDGISESALSQNFEAGKTYSIDIYCKDHYITVKEVSSTDRTKLLDSSSRFSFKKPISIKNKLIVNY